MFDVYGLNDSMKTFVGKIASYNYYNEIHKIIRVEFNNRFYDFKYLGGYDVPNPSKHIAIIITSEKALDDIGLSDNRLRFLPGVKDENGSLIDIPLGFVYTVPNEQQTSTTNPNSGGAGFSIENTNMFDLDKVAIAISPPLQKDYTSTDGNLAVSDPRSSAKEDLKNQSVGLFINNDGTILIKSKGSSITMGEEGVYFAGIPGWESSSHEKEWMMDNQFTFFIPSTIPTAAISIPTLPNIAKFAKIADGARMVRNVVSKATKVADPVQRIQKWNLLVECKIYF